MTHQQLQEIQGRRFDMCNKTAVAKNKEYAPGKNALQNFYDQGEIEGCNPIVALRGNLTKHIASLMDMINGKVQITQKLIDEKHGDIIVYLNLLEALYTEMSLIDAPLYIDESKKYTGNTMSNSTINIENIFDIRQLFQELFGINYNV